MSNGELSDEIYREISSLSAYGDKLVEANRIDEGIGKYKEALSFIPKPYEDWEAATWLFVAIGDARFRQKDYLRALKCFINAVACPNGIGNPFIHLRLGQCNFELGEKKLAEEELLRAYMGGGEEIFEEDDSKYFSAISSLV
ncbi:tetratricopeptide repeat protein [Vibrio brasiliensis]|uniref:tetratricopeptide repeat protein n=1 Tax=Vibrio brasiliensis TaxID=170652 RepID=UPI001EFC615A|nr:tetratricopeptide repeat protein [Vibrio brasiliensis]MCG9752727.1 tetratricopeptide repeat protein [Vibrio brasiliensis]MCG9781936.1 tetratricopeptide repeat protein [Vibrio brasiliensis]